MNRKLMLGQIIIRVTKCIKVCDVEMVVLGWMQVLKPLDCLQAGPVMIMLFLHEAFKCTASWPRNEKPLSR